MVHKAHFIRIILVHYSTSMIRIMISKGLKLEQYPTFQTHYNFLIEIYRLKHKNNNIILIINE